MEYVSWGTQDQTTGLDGVTSKTHAITDSNYQTKHKTYFYYDGGSRTGISVVP